MSTDEDPELGAMSAVVTALEPLDGDGRERVLTWAVSRFNVDVGSNKMAKSPFRPSEADAGGEQGGFGDFADLFHAASPGTTEEKLLVASYWFQVVEGQATFGSTSLNAELTNLGHKVTKIARVLGGMLQEKPAPLLQVSKSSSSPHARKTYKLSNEGVEIVRRMISGTRS